MSTACENTTDPDVEPMIFDSTPEFAAAQDAADPLASFRDRFHLPTRNGEDVIYLCGNSLGLQPRAAQELLEEELADWRRLGVEGHVHARRPWLPYHELLTEQTAALVGASPLEVVIANTLTVNLHLMMVSFFRPESRRRKILIEDHAFPSDRYAVVSQLEFHGLEPDDALIKIGPRDGETCIRPEDIDRVIDENAETLALVMLPGVQYYTGQLLDIARITARAHAVGALVGFDLAHAIGNVPLELHEADVDFAVWCNYKYLNAGPGAVGGLFVHERHGRNFDGPRFAGWWGHDKSTRFEMGPEFVPIPGAEGWQLSNPPILSMTPLIASMQTFTDAGMGRLRRKSEKLTGYLEYLLREKLDGKVEIITPHDPSQRGCQLSLKVKAGGRAFFERLARTRVICDWREPDVVRAAPVPLYNTFRDVYDFISVLEDLLK